MKNKIANIFTEVELYNYCLAQVCAMGITEDTGYHSDWSEFVKEDYVKKIDSLSNIQQEYFEAKLLKVSINLKSKFNNLLSQDTKTDEDFEYHLENKRKLVNKVGIYMEDFLID